MKQLGIHVYCNYIQFYMPCGSQVLRIRINICKTFLIIIYHDSLYDYYDDFHNFCFTATTTALTISKQMMVLKNYHVMQYQHQSGINIRSNQYSCHDLQFNILSSNKITNLSLMKPPSRYIKFFQYKSLSLYVVCVDVCCSWLFRVQRGLTTDEISRRGNS